MNRTTKNFVYLEAMKTLFCIKLELLRLIYRKKRAISFIDRNEAPIRTGPEKFRRFEGKYRNFGFR